MQKAITEKHFLPANSVKSLLFVFLVFSPVSWVAAAEDRNDSPDTIDELFRVDPESILEIRKKQKRQDEVLTQNIHEFKEKTQRITLYQPARSPLDSAPAVHTLNKSPSVVMFTDVAGEPWPISGVTGYDEELITAEFSTGEGETGNVLLLTTNLAKGTAYLAVTLKGNNVPVIISVRGGTDTYHTITDISVQALSPTTQEKEAHNLRKQQELAGRTGLNADIELNHVLLGVAPDKSKKRDTNDPEVLAWEKEGMLLVRTRYRMILPQPIRVEEGYSGYRAYRLPVESRLTMTNKEGKVVRLKINIHD